RAEVFAAGYRDPDPRVRGEALRAAAWRRQDGLLAHLRACAGRPTADQAGALGLLGVLGKPEDLAPVLAVGQTADLGPFRFQVLGAYGHPGVVETVLRGVESKEPRTAAAAGAAF